MSRFENKVVFITGAAAGIGQATARRFFAEGATVILADRDVEAAQRLADELNAPERAAVVPLDIMDVDSVEEAVQNAVDRFGRINVLASVAGGVPAGWTEDLTEKHWNNLVELNLTGPMRCIRAVRPHLSEGDSIVLVGSVNGLAAWGGLAYSAAKSGLVNLAQNLAVELGPLGVRINVVAPGTVRTQHWERTGGPERMIPLYPLGRVGEPSDIASAIAFLASEDASWITGVTLPVDGGGSTGPQHLLTHGREWPPPVTGAGTQS